MSEENPSSPENLVLLLSQHQESIFRYIYCLVPVEADARDIQQETSLALYRKWEQFDTSRPFLPWAFTFAFIQVQKHRAKSARSPLTFDPDVLASVNMWRIISTGDCGCWTAACRNSRHRRKNSSSAVTRGVRAPRRSWTGSI